MKNIIRLTLFLLVFISLSFMYNHEKTIVIIDAGHGGTDLGATINGVSEKEIVASIANKIQVLNTNRNIEIILIRNYNENLSLQERVDFINNMKPDLVLSLHINANKNTEINGLEVFVSEKSSEYLIANQYAEKFISTISTKSKLKVNPVKKASFFILRKSEVPTLLLELGYLSNQKDKAIIENKESQIEIAQHILNFIATIKS